MNKWSISASILVVGLAIFCGVMANADYHDPAGIAWLLFLGFVSGLAITASLMTKNNSSPTAKDNAEHKVD